MIAIVALLATAHDVAKVVDEMTLPGMEVSVEVMPCGQINAFYYPPMKAIVVCREALELDPGVLRFFIAHEMAHAIIDQYDIPVPSSEEAAADELAAVALIGMGDKVAVVDVSMFFANHPDTEDVWDDHQSHAKRAASALCLVAGSEAVALLPDCGDKFHHAARTWLRLLGH